MTYISTPQNSIKSTNNSSTSAIGGIDDLDGAINNSATTITLTDASEFPSGGGTIVIDSEYITYTGISTNDLTGCSRGAFGSTAASHDDAATVTGAFVGTSDYNNYPDAMCSNRISQAGTLYFEFSNDNSVWNTFSVNGFTVTASIFEFHTAVKGYRYFRIRFVTSGTSQATTVDISVYYGVFRQGNLPLNQSISDDADSMVVRAVSVGKQPDGDYVNSPADGQAFSTTSTLGGGGSYTSSWTDSDGWSTIELLISSDVISAIDGVQFDFTDNVQADTPTVRASSYYTFTQQFIDYGFMAIKLPTLLDGFRLTYTNGDDAQSSFYLSTTLRTSPTNNFYNKAQALVTADFFSEVALNNISNYSIDIKFGRNPQVDTTTDPEDVWEVGGTYTGHPTSFTPETVDIVSSSTADTSAGTGARTVRIFGLKTSSSTDYESEDLTMNGQTNVTSVNMWWRVNRAYVLTAGSGGQNAGNITIQSTDTTANVFCRISTGYNQTLTGAYTVPAERNILVKRILTSITRASGAAGSALITFRARESGGVYRVVAAFDVQTGVAINDEKLGGIKLSAGTDIKFRCESVSDNDTIVNAKMEYVLMTVTS